ncbi:hypothetical protein J2T12_003960 [Paenibacillus anaericanus]|uniref:hypothetical protein n=1 Tax=Paenibacillus anaericanus TaxID=170367 RepID=UPI00277DA04F|nr:hypothetical protein [Paenibacillus anaericanus]MDQ0090537.1 hypothetical protein [Paenibacillus anaericanus]
MSWDVISDNVYTCPCGKSTYEVTTEMDDWNSTREKVTMNCLECKDKYQKKYFYKSDGEERWSWVLKKMYDDNW